MNTGDGIAQCPVCGEYYYIQIGHTCKRLKECQDDFATIAVMSEGWRIKYTDLLCRVKEAVGEIDEHLNELVTDANFIMMRDEMTSEFYSLSVIRKHIPELED